MGATVKASYFRLTHEWIYMLTTLAYLVFVAYYTYNIISFFDGKYIVTLKSTLGVGIITFIFFLFTAYEFGSELSRRDGLEMIESIQGGSFKVLFGQLVVLASLLFLPLIIMFTFMLFIYVEGGLDYQAFLSHSMLALLRYVIAPGFIAILLGLVLRKSSRAAAYAIMALATLLVSNIPHELHLGLYTVREFEIARILDWFQLTVPSQNWFADGIYGVPLELSRMLLPLVWMSLFAGILLLSIKDRRKNLVRSSAIAFFLIALLCGTRFAFRGSDSVMYLADRPSALTNPSEQIFYYQNMQMEIDRLAKEYPGKMFHVTDYEMKFDAAANLKSEVTMTVDETDLDAYLFTLHHSYVIMSVLDDRGRDVPYERISDYLILRPEAPTHTFTSIYKGVDSIKFFANHQNMTLPAYHAYYPRAGFYELWIDRLGTYRANTDFENSNYRVSVNAPYAIESNLEQSEENLFTGVAEGLTLLGGHVISAQSQGISYVYGPLTGQMADYDVERHDEIGEQLGLVFDDGKDYSAKDKRIFFMPIFIKQGGDAEEPVVFDDHVLVTDIQPTPDVAFMNYLSLYYPLDFDTDELVYMVIQRIMSDETNPVEVKPDYETFEFLKEYEEFYMNLDLFSLSTEEFDAAHERMNEYMFLKMDLAELLDYQIQELGRVPVLQALTRYLTSEERNMHYLDFLYNLEDNIDQ